jgi:acyl-CoA hydrolase
VSLLHSDGLPDIQEGRHPGGLLSSGIVERMQQGVIDNTRKRLDRGKTVVTFCMGRRDTYEYLCDNPAIEFRTVDYTNDPLIITQHERMTAINSALESAHRISSTC